jgi:hypothetical protein
MAPSDIVRRREDGQKAAGAVSELHDPQARNAAKVAQVSGGDRIPEFHGGGAYYEVAERQVDAVRRPSSPPIRAIISEHYSQEGGVHAWRWASIPASISRAKSSSMTVFEPRAFSSAITSEIGRPAGFDGLITAIGETGDRRDVNHRRTGAPRWRGASV